MAIELFAGTWDFDPSTSELKFPPSHWQQIIDIQHVRIGIREEISRETGDLIVEVDAVLDGEFYPVKGSPLVDEIRIAFMGNRSMPLDVSRVLSSYARLSACQQLTCCS